MDKEMNFPTKKMMINGTEHKADIIIKDDDWFETMTARYAPLSKDDDVAFQNMGLTIEWLENELKTLKKLVDAL